VIPESVRDVLGLRAHQAAEDAVGEDSAGVDEGDRVRLSGEGEPGVNGGPPGTSTCRCTSSRTRCSSATTTTCIARCRSPSPPPRSAAKSTIPTLDGSAKIRVPAETQSGKTFRLKGKGIKGVRSHEPGELFCHVVVETPVSLHRAPASAAARVRIDQLAGQRAPQPARQGLVRQSEEPSSRAESRGAPRRSRVNSQVGLALRLPLLSRLPIEGRHAQEK
jgi:DnaJ-class molecular chaperone